MTARHIVRDEGDPRLDPVRSAAQPVRAVEERVDRPRFGRIADQLTEDAVALELLDLDDADAVDLVAYFEVHAEALDPQRERLLPSTA